MGTQDFLASENTFFALQEDSCSVVVRNTNIPDIKSLLDNHHLVVRLEEQCIFYYLLVVATNGMVIAIGTLNKPV